MISSSEYKVISDKIHEMQDILVNTASVAVDMQATTNALSLAYIAATPATDFQNSANEVDYFADINATLVGIESAGTELTAGSRLIPIVRELQLHILARYDSIDEWLGESGILVKQRFYDLSNDLGYEISPTYLE